MADTIRLTPQDLIDLASRLRNVQSELSKAVCVFNDDGTIASGRIDGALEEFSAGWSDKRSQLLTDLQNAGGFLNNYAETMVKKDTDLKGALNPPSDRGGGSNGSGGPRPASPGPAQIDEGGATYSGLGAVAGGGAVYAGATAGRQQQTQPVSVTHNPQPLDSEPSQPPAIVPPAVVPPSPANYDSAGGAVGSITERGFQAGTPVDRTAWSLNQMLEQQDAGWRFDNFMTVTPDGNHVPHGEWGEPNGWLGRADELGFEHDTEPKVGSVAVWDDSFRGGKGHVAIVREVGADGQISVDWPGGRDGALSRPFNPGTKRWPKGFIHIVPGT